MQDSNRYIRLTLIGKKRYRCLLTPENVIISVEPENDFLLYKNLNDVYNKFNKSIVIKDMIMEDPPYLVAEDVYQKFIERNPKIEYLAEKFNCELL